MKDMHYILAKVVWCGECDDFAIEEIVRIKSNIPFTSKEIYHHINLNYIHDDWSKGVRKYREGNRLYYYVYDVDYDFDPHRDSLTDALALYTVYHYQQTEITNNTFNIVEQKKTKLWQVCWKHFWYTDETISWIYAEDAATAKEILEKSLSETPIIIWIQEG